VSIKYEFSGDDPNGRNHFAMLSLLHQKCADGSVTLSFLKGRCSQLLTGSIFRYVPERNVSGSEQTALVARRLT